MPIRLFETFALINQHQSMNISEALFVARHERPDLIMIDCAARICLVSGQPVDLLATLIALPGRVFSRLKLLDRSQGTAYEGYERTIDVHEPDVVGKQVSQSDLSLAVQLTAADGQTAGCSWS